DKAQWHPEGKEVDAEVVETAAVQFDGYEILKVFSISAKAHKMSIQAFESYVTEELTYCVMDAIADAVVNGDGIEIDSGLIEVNSCVVVKIVRGTNLLCNGFNI